MIAHDIHFEDVLALIPVMEATGWVYVSKASYIDQKLDTWVIDGVPMFHHEASGELITDPPRTVRFGAFYNGEGIRTHKDWMDWLERAQEFVRGPVSDPQYDVHPFGWVRIPQPKYDVIGLSFEQLIPLIREVHASDIAKIGSIYKSELVHGWALWVLPDFHNTEGKKFALSKDRPGTMTTLDEYHAWEKRAREYLEELAVRQALAKKKVG